MNAFYINRNTERKKERQKHDTVGINLKLVIKLYKLLLLVAGSNNLIIIIMYADKHIKMRSLLRRTMC